MIVGIAYDGRVANSHGEEVFCSVKDCTVELATLQVQGLDATLRLATSRQVSPVASGSGNVKVVDDALEDIGESDDSFLDGDYVPPKVVPSSSDSESDSGLDFGSSRLHKVGSKKQKVGPPVKVSKLGRKAAKVS